MARAHPSPNVILAILLISVSSHKFHLFVSVLIVIMTQAHNPVHLAIPHASGAQVAHRRVAQLAILLLIGHCHQLPAFVLLAITSLQLLLNNVGLAIILV